MPSPAGKDDDFESPGPAIRTYSAALEFVSLPKGVGGEASARLTLCKQFQLGGRRSDWLIIIRMKVLRTDLHIIPSKN